MEFINGKTIAVALGGLVIGALLYAMGGSKADLLKKNMTSRLETIDSRLKTLDTKAGTVDSVTGKVAELEQSLTSSVDALKTASSSELSGVAKRIKELEAKIAELTAAQQASESKIAAMTAAAATAAAAAANASAASQAGTPSDSDGVSLAIAQSKWLVKNKLYVALSYIYPGEDKIRVGVGDKVMDLSKGTPEEFFFEGKRCNVQFDGLDGDKALISHTCSS